MSGQSEQPVSTVPETASIGRMRRGDHDAFVLVMRQHNQRMFRIARAILKDDGEAEDMVQEAYIKAFTNLDSLSSMEKMGAWLARITANLAISRSRQLKRQRDVIQNVQDNSDTRQTAGTDLESLTDMTPERLAAIGEIRNLVENEIDNLPDGFREVFMLRVVEGMSVDETADVLGVLPPTVKSRLHRARRTLRVALESPINDAALNAFPFLGVRCDRIVLNVMSDLADRGVVDGAQQPR